MISNIVKGLCYLHERSIIYRDLHLGNFLIFSDLIVKLTDFGIARDLSNVSTSLSVVGIPESQAPEVCEPEKYSTPYSTPSEIWGVGIVIADLFRECPKAGLPKNNCNPAGYKAEALRIMREREKQQEKNFTDFIELVEACLSD
jgi:serine/threonine protein kinase